MIPTRVPGFTPWLMVYSPATNGANDHLFFPMVGPLDVSEVAEARAALAIYGISGASIEIKVGWQKSDDPHVGPPSSTTDGTFQNLGAKNSEGVHFTDGAFETLSSLTKGYIWLGVETRNTAQSPTSPVLAFACIRVETKKP